MKTFEKTEEELLRRYLQINKQLQKITQENKNKIRSGKIRSGNVIIFNFANIGNVWHQKKQN